MKDGPSWDWSIEVWFENMQSGQARATSVHIIWSKQIKVSVVSICTDIVDWELQQKM